jgi:hypothetical protein
VFDPRLVRSSVDARRGFRRLNGRRARADLARHCRFANGHSAEAHEASAPTLQVVDALLTEQDLG